jgi:hypothetical protein
MDDQGIADTGVFEQWLKEERVYLQGLSKEPISETKEMEYYQKLVNFHASTYILATHPLISINNGPRATLAAAHVPWQIVTPET